MAEEFKDVIAQLQENNKLEAKRDSNLNKNIAYSREVNTSKFDALQGQMVIQTEVTKVPDEKVPDEKVPDESDYERVERAREKNKESDTGAAETEENAEKESGEKKTRNLLTKIAGGIGGILSSMKDSAKRALKGGLSFLKKTLFAGAILAILAFINSKYWDDFVNWAAEGAVFLSQKIIPAIKKLGETFSGIADFLGLTNTELAVYALGGIFAFKLISKVLKIGKSLLGVGKFLTSGIITPLVNVVKNAPKVIWDAIKNIGTVFKNVRLFMMSNIINR